MGTWTDTLPGHSGLNRSDKIKSRDFVSGRAHTWRGGKRNGLRPRLRPTEAKRLAVNFSIPGSGFPFQPGGSMRREVSTLSTDQPPRPTNISDARSSDFERRWYFRPL